MVSPIGPEEDPSIRTWIQCNTTWLIDIFGKENHPIGTVFTGDFDRVESRIDPVEILSDPIQRQAFNQIGTAADDGHGRSRQFFAEDLFRFHIVPVEDVGVGVGGQRYHVLHFDGDDFDRFLLEIGDEQRATV